MRRRQERLGLGFAALCALNGAFVPAVAKLTTDRADPLFVATATTCFGALAAAVVLGARGELRQLADRRTAPGLVAIGALGTALAFLLFFAGAQRSSAIETVLCLQIESVYALVLARIFLGHPMTPRRLAAVAGIVGGIALALNPSGFSGWVGVALLLATPLGWVVSHLITLRALRGVPPRTLASARYLFGGAILTALWLAAGGASRLPPPAVLARLVPVLVLQGMLLSFVGTLFWYETIKRLDLARSTAIVVPSVPLLSLGASFLLLGEVAQPRQWLGLVLTATGVLAFVTAPHSTAPDLPLAEHDVPG
jgi:drug/metabolite transporter (DMT)-like permease